MTTVTETLVPASFPSVFHRLVAVTAGTNNDQGDIS
jgi:hypothetical protein